MEPRAIRAAMVRFPTIARDRWDDVVGALAAIGFDTIDVPLVWREHELDPGVFDFETGRRSVREMLATIDAHGLSCIVRLGPLATDDAPGLGLPEFVLFDRACQARTRRQSPVLVPDPPRAVPLPSLASRAYREASTRWVAAAVDAVVAATRESHAPVRWVVGHGPHAMLRDDPFEIDHHPDARGELAAVDPPHDGPSDGARAEVERACAQQVSFTEALAATAVAHGAVRECVVVAVPGSLVVSPAAHDLAARWRSCTAVPPPVAGTRAIWRQTRHALALGNSHGVHLDVWSGGPAYYPPARGSHTVEAARVAIAAGARDVTVRMGAAGDRWMGAIVSERGEARPHAPLWHALLAWADTVPAGNEQTATVVTSRAWVVAARAATGVHPLPVGLLGLLGASAGDLAVDGAPFGDGTVGGYDARRRAVRDACEASGIPVRCAPETEADAITDDGVETAERFVSRAKGSLADVTAPSDPPGAVLVRAIAGDGVTTLVLASTREIAATVTLPGARTWRDAEGTVCGATVTLDPGAAVVLTGEEK